MGTAMKHPVPDRVKPLFVILGGFVSAGCRQFCFISVSGCANAKTVSRCFSVLFQFQGCADT